MTDWLRWLRDIAAHRPAALITVLATEGSAPRGAGTRMLVTADALHGTIGGGQLEFRAIEQARAILALPAGSWRIQDYPLGPLLGQCCGGRVRLLVEHVDPARLGWLTGAIQGQILVSTLSAMHVERHVSDVKLPVGLSARGERPGPGASFAEIVGQYQRPVYLFGAGHVGQAIAHHAQGLPFQLAWFDSRPDYAAISGVTVAADADIVGCLEEAPSDAAVLILTHDHDLDYRLTRAALERAPVAFVGLIGSATKGARFRSRLDKDGVGPEARAQLTSPIGISGVHGKEPDVIAVATLAQLLQL